MKELTTLQRLFTMPIHLAQSKLRQNTVNTYAHMADTETITSPESMKRYKKGFYNSSDHILDIYHDRISLVNQSVKTKVWLVKVALSDTWPFQKNSNSIKKKLQLNVLLQELKRQGFGVPSP